MKYLKTALFLKIKKKKSQIDFPQNSCSSILFSRYQNEDGCSLLSVPTAFPRKGLTRGMVVPSPPRMDLQSSMQQPADHADTL